jgi:hypothetical protein
MSNRSKKIASAFFGGIMMSSGIIGSSVYYRGLGKLMNSNKQIALYNPNAPPQASEVVAAYNSMAMAITNLQIGSDPIMPIYARGKNATNKEALMRFGEILEQRNKKIMVAYNTEISRLVKETRIALSVACSPRAVQFVTGGKMGNMYYGSCDGQQSELIEKWLEFEDKFVRKQFDDIIEELRDRAEGAALLDAAQKVSKKRIKELLVGLERRLKVKREGRGAVLLSDIGVASAYVFNRIVMLVLAIGSIMGIAQVFGMRLAAMEKVGLVKLAVDRNGKLNVRPPTANREVIEEVAGSSPPNKRNTAAKKIQSAVRKSQFRKKLRTALKKKGPAKPPSPPKKKKGPVKPPSPPKKSTGASGSGSRSANKNTAPKKPPSVPALPRPPTAPKNAQPSRNNLFTQIRAGTPLKSVRKKSPKKNARNNLLSQIRAGTPLKSVKKKSPKKSPNKSMVNPVLAKAMAMRRTVMRPNSA